MKKEKKKKKCMRRFKLDNSILYYPVSLYKLNPWFKYLCDRKQQLSTIEFISTYNKSINATAYSVATVYTLAITHLPETKNLLKWWEMRLFTTDVHEFVVKKSYLSSLHFLKEKSLMWIRKVLCVNCKLFCV